MNQSVLDGFRLSMVEKDLHVYGVHVETKDGDGVTHFWRSDELVNLYSGSKTFTSLAVGICTDDGKLNLSDKVLDFFPEYKSIAAPQSEEITVRDLLHMASGKTEFWFGALDGEMNTKDWAELFFRVPVSKKPGTYFCYSNACTYMLGRVVEKVTGKNVRDFLLPRLFVPLGIENPQWHTDPNGHTMSAIDLYLHLGEFSHLGSLLLHNGEFNGKRIVSEKYLDDLVGDCINNNFPERGNDPESSVGYGYQIWRCTYPGAFRADGIYGQFCIIFPDKGVAVTVISHEEKRPSDIIRAVYDDILPRLS